MSSAAVVIGALRVKMLYLLNLWMEVIQTWPVRYWSEVLCCTIPTHMSDLEVKVTDLEKILLKFLVKVFRSKAEFR